MSEETVAITVDDRQQAFLEARYAHVDEAGWMMLDDEILYAVYSALPATEVAS